MKNAKKSQTASLQGAEGRRWRRQLAESATFSDDKTIRTLKFPLHVDEKQRDNWPAIHALGKVVNSSGHGSLIGYLFALYTGGFLIFGKQAEADAFRNGAILNDQDWKESVLPHVDLTIASNSFVPSSIYQRLLVTPRSVGGKDVAFTADIITNEWAKYFCKGKYGDSIPLPEQKLFGAIAKELLKHYEGWKSVAKDTIGAASAVDKALKRLGYPESSRSLASRIGDLRPCEPAGSLAHNPNAILIGDAQGIEMHVMVAQAFFRARLNGLESAKELTKAAQIAATGDANHGGASWVLGKGLNYFRQTPTDQVMADFAIAEQWRSAIEAVKSQATAIPVAQDTFFGDASYSPYRSKIGGVLTSWIANYSTRLFDLDSVLSEEIEPFQLPEPLIQDETLLLELGMRASDLEALLADAVNRRGLVAEALHRLMGKQSGMSRADIDTIEGYNDELSALAGTLNMIESRIAKLIESAELRKEPQVKELLETYKFSLPKWIRPLERLNRLNLEPADPLQVLNGLCREFDLLHDAMHKQFASIEAWAVNTGETLNVIKRQSAREAAHLRNTKSNRDPEEMAIRVCLNMLGSAARRCSDETVAAVAKWMRKRQIFADPAHLNQYLFNRKGRLYKSAYDSNPKQPYAIKRDVVSNASKLLVEFGQFVKRLRQQYLSNETPGLREVTDLYTLERAWFNVRMLGMPDAIPSELALPETVKDVFNLPTDIQLALRRDNVTSAVLRKIFNHYYVRLTEVSSKLFRTRWHLDAQFCRAADTALIYCSRASDKAWTPPSHLFASAKPIGEVMRLLRDTDPNGATGKIDPIFGFSFAIEQREKGLTDQSVRDYLREAPHRWYYAWPAGEEVMGVQVSKDGINKRVAKFQAAPLVGPRHYMGILDTMLARPDQVTIGDIAVNVRQHFAQSITRGDGDRFVVELTPTEMAIDLALPVSETRKEAVPLQLSRYVAIDLGERGLAYAVFDVETHEEIERGRWGIRQMQRLVKDEQAGHRKRSDSCKFGAKFDKAEIKRRESIVGEYCHAINSLMRHYSAFPVLEYAPGGAGGNIDRVYTGAIEHYLFSGTPTVDASRAAYWAGASVWKHPTLRQFKYDRVAAKRTQQIEPLSLFPGVGVSASGTSQECSCCMRNPVKMAREWVETLPKGAAISVNDDGTVDLGGQGSLLLHKSAHQNDRDSYRSRNQRTPLTVPLGQMKISGDDLLRQIRRNLRQAPISQQVQDTTQSIYQCLFVDCGKRLHADENAAVNIGRRFRQARPNSV